ncbi:MAG: Panacea domain-containing protein [Chitinophagaceae bacterium]
MKPNFREEKATQLAALLLKLRGGRMSYLKLMKLMYLVDRAALLRWGRPVTFDNIVSMNNGLVLSQTLDLITGGSRLGVDELWRRFISEPQGYEVALENEPEFDELSKAEVSLVEEIFGKFGRMSRWELVDLTHTFPEWTDPKGSSIPVDYKEVLEAGEKSEREIFEILSDLEEVALLEHLLTT